MNTTALIFRNTTFDVVDHNGDTWLRGLQVASALGYKNPSADISNLYDRHADEFTADMTAMVKLPTEGGEQEIRIFSPRGCYALAMFARTKAAKEFRRWVLDVLEAIRKTGKYEAAPYSVNPGDTLTKTQADTLRDLLTSTVKKLPQEKQASAMIRGWSKLKAHFGTGYRQIPQSEYAEALSIVARHCVTVHALEGELLEAEPKHDSLNETVAKWVKQIEAGNGTPIEVFEPLVKAVLKKRPSAGHEAMESLILDLLSKQRFTLSFIQLEHGLLKPQIQTHHVNAQTLVPQAVINDIRDRSFNFFPDALIPDLINAIGDRMAGAHRSTA